MHIQLVTLGHVLCETIVYQNGSRKGPVLGSPAAYAGAVSARLGVATGIVTKVGPDVPAELLQPLRDAGVDLSGVDFGSAVTTTNELVYAADGAKELKYLKQAGPITVQDIPESYRHASAFHVCPLDYEVSPTTISEIARLGAIMGVDLGGYGGAHVRRDTKAQKQLSPSILGELISKFTVAKASDEDARLLFSRESLSEREAARRLVEWGAAVGIITMGARGSLVFTKKQQYVVPAIGRDVTDVTGGGDSYMAGFLVEFMKTGDVWKSGLFAAAVAHHVIERTGGVLAERMPTERAARSIIPAEIRPTVL